MRIHPLLYPFYFIAALCFGSHTDIVSADLQQWTAGQERSGYGTNYTITLVTHCSSEKIKFQGLWYGKKYFPVKVINKTDGNDYEGFSKGDTLLLSATERIIPEKFRVNTVKETPRTPPNYKGKGAIEFSIKGKGKLLEIQSFHEKEALSYP